MCLKNAKLELLRARPVVDDWDRAAPQASDMDCEASEDGRQDAVDRPDSMAPADRDAAKLSACPSEIGSEALETASCASDDSSDSGWSVPSKSATCSEHRFDGKTAFDGCWVGRGVLAGSTFTFDDGPCVPVHYLSRDELELTVDGERHRGKLAQDGTLQWDDGDVWRRGVTDAVSERFGIRLHSRVRTLHRQSAGVRAGDVGAVVGFTSECIEVKFKRRIVRCSPCAVAICDEGDMQKKQRTAAGSCSAADAQIVRPFDGIWANRGEMKGTQFTFKNGPQVEVSLVGDREIELYLDSERHRGVMQDDGTVHWDDGDIWRREETVVTSQTAFEMFAPVQLSKACAGMLAGQCGTVVGFAADRVEVKFSSKIIQCLAADLQMCTGSHTPLAQQVGCATRLPSSQAEVRTGRTYPEAVLRSKSRAFADVLRQAPEGQKLAPRKVEQIPARQAGRREVPESQSVDRKGASKRSPTIIMGRSDQPLARGSDASTASRPKPVASMDATWYTGVVRWSRGSMAWLSCEELKARFPDQDVFLHRSECRDKVMPRQRDRMVFRLMVDDGKPKALSARTEAAHQAANESLKMSLEEYHASRSKSGR